LTSKYLKSKVPPCMNYVKPPLLSYKFGRTIGQSIFNYNSVLNNLNDDDFG
jgi:hypothetical protein